MRSNGGRENPPPTSRLVPFQHRPQRLHAPLDPVRVLHRRRAGVDDRPGVLGHDVGPVSPLDDPDVQRHSAPVIAERPDRPDLGGELVYGARAPRRIDARVSRDAAYPQLELSASLAARLHRPARQRRLQHEDGTAPTGLLLDQTAGRTAAALLVRRPQHDHPEVVQAAGRGQRPHGQHPDADAGLHVEHAGSVQAAGRLAQRHALDLPHGPHRVEMPEEHHPPRRRRGPEGRSQMRAAGGRRNALDRAPHLAEVLRQPLAAAIDRGRLGGGRLQSHQLAQHVDQPLATTIAVLTQGRHAS